LNAKDRKSFLSLSIHPDYFSVVEMAGDRLYALGAKEFLQPFSFEMFRMNGESVNTYSKVIRELVKKSGCRSRDISVVLNMGMVHVKKIPMALGLDSDMISDHLKWEAEQFLIDPPEEFILDSQRLPFQTTSGNPVYLIVLVRRYIIEHIKQLVQKAGLRLVDIDVDLFSNLRMLVKNYALDAEETAVLINIQQEAISIAIIRNREYYLSHTIDLYEGGAPGEMSASQIAEKIIKDLKRLAFGHRLGQSVDELGRFFLIGGSPVREISQELSDRISSPVEVVNPFNKIRIPRSLNESKAFTEFPERFASSVGGALKLS